MRRHMTVRWTYHLDRRPVGGAKAGCTREQARTSATRPKRWTGVRQPAETALVRMLCSAVPRHNPGAHTHTTTYGLDFTSSRGSHECTAPVRCSNERGSPHSIVDAARAKNAVELGRCLYGSPEAKNLGLLMPPVVFHHGVSTHGAWSEGVPTSEGCTLTIIAGSTSAIKLDVKVFHCLPGLQVNYTMATARVRGSSVRHFLGIGPCEVLQSWRNAESPVAGRRQPLCCETCANQSRSRSQNLLQQLCHKVFNSTYRSHDTTLCCHAHTSIEVHAATRTLGVQPQGRPTLPASWLLPNHGPHDTAPHAKAASLLVVRGVLRDKTPQGPDGEDVAVVAVGDAAGAVEDARHRLLLPIAVAKLASDQEPDTAVRATAEEEQRRK